MTRICKAQDVIKFTVRVLQNSHMCYTNNTFLLIIETEYPNLKGTIYPDFMKEKRYDELTAIDREWIKPVAGILHVLLHTISGLIELFGMNATTLLRDDSIGVPANKFFIDSIGDLFRFDTTDYDLTLWKSNLDQYALSVVCFINLLSELIYNKGELNTEKKLSAYNVTPEYTVLDHLNRDHQLALHLLQAINEKMREYHQDIIKVDFPN